MQIPVDGFSQSRLEGLGRHKTQFALDLRRIYGVPPVVPRAIIDEFDQCFALLTARLWRAGKARSQIIALGKSLIHRAAE